ncbi:MAG: DUF433 domain-containing protein [Anaerolineaceae bacterium]|nr:DUF433 domain-containing protein [Anaerolineaceae bacterium]
MKASSPETVDLTKYITLETDRPHIRGRRIPVATIAYNARDNGWDVATLMNNFGLSQAEVLAALLYYQEHVNEIDVQEQDYQVQLDRQYEQHGCN